MRRATGHLVTIVLFLIVSLPGLAGAGDDVVIDHEIGALNGGTIDLGDLRGQVVLIVNTASKCGYTPQYEGLQELYTRYRERGLVVVGVPSNDFGRQEPGTAKEIQSFCKKNFGVTFPMAEKTRVLGENKAPLYRTLTEETPEGIRGEIGWNFTKFLVDRDGHVAARFDTRVDPLDPALVSRVEALLGDPS